jgi:hypothetical protein
VESLHVETALRAPGPLDFLGWNDAIAAHFFRPENAGQPVYLYVTRATIETIGGTGSVPAFVAAMQAGPPWATRTGLCQRALQAMRDWRTRGLKKPPYVGFLALFVLALDQEGFHPNAYYARLRTLLGEEPVNGMYNSFDHMIELWDDLESWLNDVHGGALGILRTDIAGSWINVGLPAAQAILTAEEREHLYGAFAEEGLDPEYPPSDLELRGILLRHRQGLRPRTVHALEEKQQSEYANVLLDRIAAELEAWDGTAPTDGAGQERAGQATVFLCLRIDDISKRVTAELRCKFAKFPETVALHHGGDTYTCREAAGGYSSTLTRNDSVVNAAALDWRKPIVFHDSDGKASARFAASNHRVFESGKERGISGFVEVPRIDPTRPFRIAAAPDVADQIAAWGASSVSGFAELKVSGLPEGWRFFTGNAAVDDAAIRDVANRLSFQRELRRIRVAGGIHVPGKQTYFRFAPPAARLDGVTDQPLLMNGEAVLPDDDGAYHVPEELLAEPFVTIACGTLKRRIYFQDEQLPEYILRSYEQDGASSGSTPSVLGFPCPPPHLGAFPLPPLCGRRIDALGAHPGQLAPLTASGAPPFDPVWLVIHDGRRLELEYVGIGIVAPGKAVSEKKALKAWKELVWYGRMRITEPTFKPLRELWRKYLDAAKNA